MRINALNAHEASKQILRVVLTSDFHHSSYKGNPYGFIYVYCNAEMCRYSFEAMQRRNSTELLKRYEDLDVDEVLKITATKYTFSQIAIGATSRKAISKTGFFDIVRDHYNLIGISKRLFFFRQVYIGIFDGESHL